MISVHYETIINQCGTLGSHSSVAEDSGQVCDAASLGEGFMTFLWDFRKYTVIDTAIHPIRPVSSVINHSSLFSCIREM
jgi:hypothetical protein